MLDLVATREQQRADASGHPLPEAHALVAQGGAYAQLARAQALEAEIEAMEP